MWLSTRPWASSTGRAAPGPSTSARAGCWGVLDKWGTRSVGQTCPVWPQGRAAEAGPGRALAAVVFPRHRLSQAPFHLLPPHPSCSCSGLFFLLLHSFLRGILLFPGCSSILSCNEVELQWAQWAVCEIAASPISDPSAGDTCDPLLSTWDGMFLCWEHAVVEAHRLEVLSISSALAVCSALLPAQHQSVPTGTHTWALGCFTL